MFSLLFCGEGKWTRNGKSATDVERRTVEKFHNYKCV